MSPLSMPVACGHQIFCRCCVSLPLSFSILDDTIVFYVRYVPFYSCTWHLADTCRSSLCPWPRGYKAPHCFCLLTPSESLSLYFSSPPFFLLSVTPLIPHNLQLKQA